jgi:hypothetical protein
VQSVQVVDDHLIAAGATDDGQPLAWTSADGSSWRLVELPREVAGGATVGGMAVANGTAVLVGQVTSSDGSTSVGAIWTGPASLLAP